MKVLAIIPVYNEADILPAVLTHLHEQGVDTYVIDNWSTDGADFWGIGHLPGLIGYEKFPNTPVHVYQWERILRRVEEVALEHSEEYDWMMLHDADEIRRPPKGYYVGPTVENANLYQAIADVNKQGFNVIDFKVYTFPPVDNGWIPGNNPETYFTGYRRESGYEGVVQEKCWKVYPYLRIDLASTGGHKAQYLDPLSGQRVNTRVCPHKFILKHYPIRSQAHGERKVFEERVKRWHLGERGRDWHTQYDGMEPGCSFLADPKELIKWH
jgi:glycosyltransferase involved in cell wall biosynthesis